jgi:hypothetical protein
MDSGFSGSFLYGTTPYERLGCVPLDNPTKYRDEYYAGAHEGFHADERSVSDLEHAPPGS